MKIKMDKKYVQIDFKASYEHGVSMSNVQGIAGLSIPTKVQVAARILLEAIGIRKKTEIMNEIFGISWDNSEIVEAAKLLLTERIKAVEKHNERQEKTLWEV